ncbi:MAG: transposase [Caldilineaceae bacterium]|nr:transposase [Caldilineaceae bacterium]
MPRRKLQFRQGHYYHIYNRGAARAPIFYEPADYTQMLWTLRRYLLRFHVTLVAYCLMPNHYHWLVRQDGELPVRLLPQYVGKSYANHFNHKYNRRGALFEDRFDAILIDNDEYLRHLCRYIHVNPVKAGLTTTPEQWIYSNYQEWIGQRAGILVDHSLIVAQFRDHQHYQQFVQEYLAGYATVLPTLNDYWAKLE